MATQKGKRGLGRGLSALMADVDLAPEIATAPNTSQRPDLTIPIEKLHPNPDQPRRDFHADALAELTASIKEKGVIQPLIVRAHPDHEGEYEIVAGERRWRASQAAQLHEVPVIVREFEDIEVVEIAIIENIQRADLNPLEEAMAYRQLMERFGHTQEKVSEALGKSRSHIANLMRLLTLPEDVLQFVRDGRLSAGHARALVPLESPGDIAREIITKGLSVRDTEKRVKAQTETKPQKKPAQKDADTKALESDLMANLRLPVSIAHQNSGKGKITISYASLEELDGLCTLLTGGKDPF